MALNFSNFLLVAFSLPLKITVLGVSLLLGEIFFLVAVVYFFVAGLSSPSSYRINYREALVVALMAIFLFFVAISVFVNGGYSEGVLGAIRLLLSLMFAMVSARCVFSKLSVEKILNSIVFSGFLISIYIVVDAIWLHSYIQRPGDLYFGGAVGFMPAAAFLALGSMKGNFALRVMGFLFVVSAMMLNGTKAWLMGIALSLILLKGYQLYQNKRKKDAIIILSSAIGLFMGIIFIEELVSLLPGERFAQLVSLVRFEFEGTTLGSRFYKWELALDKISESPFFGVGYFNLNLGMPDWVDVQSNARSDSHYIDLLAMVGLLGGGFYFFCMLSLYGWALCQSSKGGLHQFVALVMGLMFFSSFFWSLFGGYMVYIFGYFLGLSVSVFVEGRGQINSLEKRSEFM